MHRLKGFLINNKFIFAAFALPVLLLVLAFAVTGIYPFGEDQIAVIDMYHQYVPFLSELQYKLQEGGNLFYTWNGAGGCNFWNLISYYGASPLNVLLILFPKKLIMEGVTFLLLIKVGLAGSFMAIYLRYHDGNCNMVTVAFASLYAMCSYVMAYYWCIMWMDAVMLLPLCMLGLNKLIDDDRAVLYVVSLALVVLSNYYMAIMVCIFIMFYYPFLYFLKVENGGTRKCVVTTGKAVGYSFLGIGMSAVMLLPTYISMQSTYYISSEMPKKWDIYEPALDVLNQLLPYTELTFREGLPNLYCGMIVVIMLVLYVLNENIPLREKLLNGTFLLFMFFSVNTNKLDFIWHGLHFPNQLPFRYTFVICFILIGIAYRMLQKKDEFSIRHMWILMAAGIGYYLIAQKLMAKQEYDIELFFYGGIAWLILYCGTIILYRKGHLTKASFSLVIVVLIVAELAASSCTSFERIGNSYRKEYFANSTDIRKLVEKTNEEFARVEMDQLYTLNDPAKYHYKGISQFSSSINADTTAIMEKLGMDGGPSRNRFNYNQTNPVTNAFFNIRYIITKNRKLEDPDFTLKDKEGYSRLYESKYPLSIGYMAEDSIRTWDTSGEDPFKVLEDYVRAGTANEYTDVFENMADPYVDAKNGTISKVADGKYNVKPENKNDKAKVTLKFTSDKTQKYYVFIEAANAEEIIAGNGNKLDDIEIRNDCGSIVNVGTIEEGKTLKLTVGFEKGKAGDMVCLVKSLDYAVWDGAYEKLSENMMTVTAYSDNHIEGNIDAEKSGVLVTSIPYEKGWKLEVDGENKEIQELAGGVFISIPLEKGNHEISLTFRPPGIFAGFVMTLAAILVLVMIQLRQRLVRAARIRGISSSGSLS